MQAVVTVVNSSISGPPAPSSSSIPQVSPPLNKSNPNYGLYKMRKGMRTLYVSCAGVDADTFAQKLSKLAAPDPFNTTSTSEGKRKVGENTLLSMRGRGVGSTSTGSKGLGKGKRFSPYAAKKCKVCNSNVSQNNAQYCHSAFITSLSSHVR